VDKSKGYFSGLGKILNLCLDFAIKFMGILGLLVGLAILYEFFVISKGKAPPAVTGASETMIITYGAIVAVLLFVFAFVYYTVMYFVRKKEDIQKEKNNIAISKNSSTVMASAILLGILALGFIVGLAIIRKDKKMGKRPRKIVKRDITEDQFMAVLK